MTITSNNLIKNKIATPACFNTSGSDIKVYKVKVAMHAFSFCSQAAAHGGGFDS